MNKYKKIIVFILLFSIFAFNTIDISYANSYVVALPEFPEKPSGFEYYFIRKIDNQYIFTWLKHTYTTIYKEKYYFTGEWVSHSWTVNNDTNEQKWSNPWGFTTGYSDNTLICSVDTTIQDCNIVYSNFDIKYNDVLLRSKLEYKAEIMDTEDTPTMTGIGGFISDLGDRIQSFFSNLFTIIQNGITTIVQTIIDLPQNIINFLTETIIFLFKPNSEIFSEIEELINEKFNVLFQIRDLISEVLDIQLYKGTPHFEVKYKDKTYELINFSMFDKYRLWICAISSFIMIFDTIMWLIRNAPNIVNSGGADTESIITNHYNNNGRVKIEL